MTSVRVGPEAADITELRSQAVVVGSIGLQQGGVILAVVNRSGRGFVLLGARPLQEASSVVQLGSPALREDAIVLTLELSLHADLVINGRSIEVEGAVAHEAGPSGVGLNGAFKGGEKSVLSVIGSLGVGLGGVGFLGLEVSVHGVNHLLLEDVVLSEVAEFSL